MSLEWKTEAVIDGESKGDDCDKVMCAERGEPMNQEECEQNEVDGMKSTNSRTKNVATNTGDDDIVARRRHFGSEERSKAVSGMYTG